MTDVVPTNIPTNGAGAMVAAEFRARMKAGIASSRLATPRTGGMNILRLLKEGVWAYGADTTQVEDGSLWCVNTYSAEHGFVCWSRYEKGRKDEVLGEKMVPVYEPKPSRPDPINGFEWADQRTFILKCMTGEDQNTQVIYKVTSIGGMNEVDALLASIEKQMEVEEAFVCPVVELLVDSYQHPKWGRTFIPVIKLHDWADINGMTQGKPVIAAPKEALDTSKLAPELAAQVAAGRPEMAEPKPEQAPAATRRRPSRPR